MEEILVQFGNYGFPMVVAVYLLVRVEKKLEALTGAINRLEQVLAVFLRARGAQDPDRKRDAPGEEILPAGSVL
jgi:hypothetical protein